jgi:hypothetical protein
MGEPFVVVFQHNQGDSVIDMRQSYTHRLHNSDSTCQHRASGDPNIMLRETPERIDGKNAQCV